MKTGAEKWRRLRQRLDAKQEKLLAEYRLLRSQCPHHNLFFKRCGSSGNWDKADDSYWIDWLCSDCNDRWTTEQTKEAVDKFPQAKEVRVWK